MEHRMDLLLNFVLGIAGSLVAGVVLVLGAGLLSKTARWVLTATLGRLLNIDTEYVFANGHAVSKDVQMEVDRAEFVDLLTGRGAELGEDTFKPLFTSSARKRRARILLPMPRLTGAGIDWTALRDKEIGVFEQSYGRGLLAQQIEIVAASLEPYVRNGTIEMRYFQMPHIGRILLTDRCAYFTPYRTDAHARDTRVTKYRRGGDTYDWLSHLFNQMWGLLSRKHKGG